MLKRIATTKKEHQEGKAATEVAGMPHDEKARASDEDARGPKMPSVTMRPGLPKQVEKRQLLTVPGARSPPTRKARSPTTTKKMESKCPQNPPSPSAMYANNPYAAAVGSNGVSSPQRVRKEFLDRAGDKNTREGRCISSKASWDGDESVEGFAAGEEDDHEEEAKVVRLGDVAARLQREADPVLLVRNFLRTCG